MSFTYTRDIPFATHSPSNDQPNMQTNTDSIDDLLNVDHISFNDANGGKHNHVTFHNAQTNPALLNGETQIYPKTNINYLETYCSTKPGAGLQINGYIPFAKAIVHFTTISSDNDITPDAGFIKANIDTVKESGGQSVITINFLAPLSTTAYYLFTADGTVFTDTIITKNTGSIVFTKSSGTYQSGRIFAFMVV